MSIEINLIPVGNGDCIHIRFCDIDGAHNIIVESGPSTATRHFRNLIESIIANGECVDLLCFSHIHDDHIKGAERTFSMKDYSTDEIKQVWFNTGCSNVDNVEEPTNDMSIESSIKLYQYIAKMGIPIENSVLSGDKYTIGKAEILILSPDSIDHDVFLEYFESKAREIDMAVGDTSKENGDSIAFMLRHDGKNMLFLGDAHRDVVIQNFKKLENVCDVSFVKLAHHGSSANINEELLNAINTNVFLVSSSATSPRPQEETLELINDFCSEERKTLLCNFDINNLPKFDKLDIINLTESSYEIDGISIKSEV